MEESKKRIKLVGVFEVLLILALELFNHKIGNTVFSVILMAATICIIFICESFKHKIIDEGIKKTHNRQILEQEAMIHSLQSQINPHFLYNTLETIRGKCVSQDQPELAEMVEVTARTLRYNINSKESYATLENEIENVKNYMKIQNFRFHNRFKLIIETDDGKVIRLDRYKLPILTLQPLVENAVHHGLEPKLGNGIVYMHIYLTENDLVISIKDDGIGMNEQELEALVNKLEGKPIQKKNDGSTVHSGVALLNIQSRLKLFYGMEYGLNVLSDPDIGTTVEIRIPRSQQQQEPFIGIN